MRLRTFTIFGFRGFSSQQEINFGDLSTFVGRNDAGKSSIMDALEQFLNDSGKLDNEDLCVAPSIEEVELIADFVHLPKKIGFGRD